MPPIDSITRMPRLLSDEVLGDTARHAVQGLSIGGPVEQLQRVHKTQHDKID
jgi:hypothetical protein